MIKLIKGDLFETKSKIIAHGVNCQGKFNSGIAKIIREKYPLVYEKYMEKYNKFGWKVGDVQAVDVDNYIIINCATQEYYGRNKNTCYVDYYGIEEVFKKLSILSKILYIGESISIPKIGSGLGNGNWDIIFAIIKNYFEFDSYLNIYYL
jgi:O-acetyl-ADP-ribose deacetylase (regulator of RNase III)